MKNDIFEDMGKSSCVLIVGLSIIDDNQYVGEVRKLIKAFKEGEKEWRVIAESDNQLFQLSLLTDIARENRISFEELKTRRDFFYQSLPKEKKSIKIDEETKTEAKYNIASLNIPAFIIKTDTAIWSAPTIDVDINNYKKITAENPEYEQLNQYIEYYYIQGDGKKYLAEPTKEMLELFDQKKVPRGIFPRDSFYETDYFQYVIWGFVFNREGKMLIHKRSENAKDNQGMWDKSIGGHIDFNKERSSQDAAIRELIEELYTVEKKQQAGHAFSMLSEDISKMYFLGDWRIEEFGPPYLNHIALLEEDKERGEENWVSYKIPKVITHNTPRILPEGRGERRLRVIVESFIFISNVGMDDEAIKEMKNSQYRLVEPAILKSWMESGKDDGGNDFEVTPDLKYIMTGELRDIIDKASLAIKFSEIRK